MMKRKWQSVTFLILILSSVSVAQAQNVKITPVGARTGDFCGTDRAMVFEDPTGVRILYDPGRTMTGGNDPRLRDIHVILISHAHVDHCGNLLNLVRQGFGGPIYCTPATRDLLEIILPDSARIQEEDAQRARVPSSHERPGDLYSSLRLLV